MWEVNGGMTRGVSTVECGHAESLIGRYSIIVESDVSIGGPHELIPPALFSWEEKGEEEKSPGIRSNARAVGIIEKCLSDWKAPLFPREGFGVSSWTTTLTNFKITAVIGSDAEVEDPSRKGDTLLYSIR